jgi:formylglycine-generating enzyme required for sulfatase activity
MRGRALVIATSEYVDPGLHPLPSAHLDAQGMAAVLADSSVGEFSVTQCYNQGCQVWRELITDFFAAAHADELLLLYVSGHGVKDAPGRLYFAATDTCQDHRLLATAIPAHFVDDVASASRSRRVVMIFDSCYSGAFAKGLHKAGAQQGGAQAVNLGDYFDKSTGRVVITATDTTQYALAGDGQPSVFTRHLIDGLRSGAADVDGDGKIGTEELVRYVSTQMRREQVPQEPRRWAFDLKGDFDIAGNRVAAELPQDLLELIDNKAVRARGLVVEELGALLRGEARGLARAAREALEKLETDPDKTVARKAAAALLEADRPAAPAVRAQTSAPPVQEPREATAKAQEAEAARPQARARKPGPGEAFRDGKDFPEMVVIPPGSFLMGSPETEPDRREDEGPVHKVVIQYALAVGSCPVIRGEWRHFVRATGRQGNAWMEPGFEQDDRHPVVKVSWQDASDYAAWLSKETRHPYHLLSEAEYEYINRAGSTTAYWWGDAADELHLYGNSDVKAVKDRFPFTSPVGSFKANPFGLFDTVGNVWCWTEDTYHPSYDGAPVDGSAWTSGGFLRVLRGGSWCSAPQSVRSANRFGDGAYAIGSVGFRVART